MDCCAVGGGGGVEEAEERIKDGPYVGKTI